MDIKQTIDEIRLRLFNSMEPPFSDTVAAKEWIEKAAAGDHRRFPPADSKEIDRLILCLQEASHSMVTLSRPSIEYPVREDNELWTETIVVPTGGTIHELARVVDRIAREVDQPKATVVGWVLMGFDDGDAITQHS